MKPSKSYFYLTLSCFLMAIMLCAIMCLTSCSLFSVKDYKIINTDAKSVASHNLSVLRYCNVNNTNYLYVDKDFNTTTRNLFVYINDLNEDLARSKACFESLEAYNIGVVQQMEKQ